MDSIVGETPPLDAVERSGADTANLVTGIDVPQIQLQTLLKKMRVNVISGSSPPGGRTQQLTFIKTQEVCILKFVFGVKRVVGDLTFGRIQITDQPTTVVTYVASQQMLITRNVGDVVA